MPVTLNEPLSALQRLCEELEYSELLEKACSAETSLDRMMWVAAFAVSYGASQARYFIVNISVLPNIDYYVAELDISHSIPC